VRFVFFLPLPVSPKFLPDPSYLKERNTSLMAYSKVLSTVASKLRYPFVDLLGPLANTEFTTNGLHPNGNGYRLIAEEITDQLNLPSARIELTSSKSEELRLTIIKKNLLYFHRWRPRNDAFVYGERKNEQKIAQTEPAQFEPFILKKESRIVEILKTITSETQ